MAGINALIQRLERFAGSEVKAKVAAKVRDAAHTEALRGFNEKRDPYGKPWAPRKRPTGWAALAWPDDGHPLLDKTGDMIGSLRALSSADLVRMTMLGYAKFHQYGTEHAARSVISTGRTFQAFKMPARMLFPKPDLGLGLWAGPVYAACVDAVKELMK